MSVDGEQHFLNLVIHNKSDLSDKPQTLFIQEVAPMFGAFMRSMSDHTQLDYGELQKIKIPPGETKTIYASGVNALPIGRPPFKVPGAMGTEGSIVLGAEGEGPVVKIYWRDPIDNIFDSESRYSGPRPSFSITHLTTNWVCLGGNMPMPARTIGIQDVEIHRAGH